MYPEYPNLYQRARKATYFSQEEAAELTQQLPPPENTAV